MKITRFFATRWGLGFLALWLLLLGFFETYSPPVRPPSIAPEVLEGIVQDEQSHPVAGATVRFRGSGHAVVSDSAGRFRLPGSPTSATITASRPGYFIAGSDRLLSPLVLTLLPLPPDDFHGYAWVDPTPDPARPNNCGNCHKEIYKEWSASGHGRAAANRYFRNLYDGTDWEGRPNVGWSLLGQYPEGSGVCSSCHAPTVSFAEPAGFDLRQVKGVAAQGVHCDFCHKVAEAPGGKVGLTHGRDGMHLLRPAAGQIFFGPLDDVDRGEDVFSPLYRESKYCASCHEGTVFGVHVYGTYTEWLASPARREGKQCQTCHAAATGAMSNVAPGKGGIERDPWTLASHRFPGGQLDMLQRCLKLSVTVAAQGNVVRATADLTADQVGHRVPTGFIDRNLLLLVEPLDGAGKVVPGVQGPTLPPFAGRDCAGKPGRLFAKQLRAEDGRNPAPFWKHASEPIDTRLFPGKPDHSEWMLPASVRRVRFRVVYRRFWNEVAVTKGWPENEIVVIEQEWPVEK